MGRVEDITKKIKDLEHKIRYSKNPMEERSLRSQVGKLQRELKVAKVEEGKL